MSEFDLKPLNPVLDEFAPQGRAALLPALHAAQDLYGCLPEQVVKELGKGLKVPLADIYGVIEFYEMFYLHPTGKKIIKVCSDPSCAIAGADAVLEAICEHLDTALDSNTPDGEYRIERAPCLGICDQAPVVQVGNQVVVKAIPEAAHEIFLGIGVPANGHIGGDARRITTNCGNGFPTSLEDYLVSGGYTALNRVLSLTPTQIIETVKQSGLAGRGGAAFPTGIKWEAVANTDSDTKYVVCNADESEPGTFKDRALLEGDPHLILESMLIAGYAVGASKGYIYVRGEYQNAFNILTKALEDARAGLYIGQDILGSGFNFDIEMRKGAGAYICGEETALFESMEGKRGFPRVKPPYPTTHGLFMKPTLINNVETLANIPYIMHKGADEYRRLGTEGSPGTKLLCVSGDVRQPGLYEIEFGTSLKRLIIEYAGGIPNGENLQAVLIGGAAGAFISPEQIDIKLTFEDLNQTGTPLGSGAVIVFDDSRVIMDMLVRIGRFFAHESCGKCYPCQLGTQRQYEILKRTASGKPLTGDIERLTDVGWSMSDASICGLGQTAANAVRSAVNLWPELFAA